MQIILLGVVTLLILIAMFWIGVRVYRQWNKPNKLYQAQMEEIQRRKRELGIEDDD